MMFQSNQNRLFEKTKNMETDNIITPDANESKAFWGIIWDNPVDYNSRVDWLKEVEDSPLSGVQRQSDIVITTAIRRFQGDSLSPLLFVVYLSPKVLRQLKVEYDLMIWETGRA